VKVSCCVLFPPKTAQLEKNIEDELGVVIRHRDDLIYL